MKIFYIVFANLALPFLLFYLRNYAYKVYYVFILKNKKKEVPSLNVKLAIKLLSAGVIMLALVLVYFRLQDETDVRETSRPVNQYNFR